MIKLATMFSLLLTSGEHFSKTYNRAVLDIHPNEFNTNCRKVDSIDIPSISLTLEKVLDGILDLKHKQSHGPDGIPPYFLRRCIFTMTYPLCLLFEMS